MSRMTPRRRWVGRTVTAVSPPAATVPPGTASTKGSAPDVPTTAGPSYAATRRSKSSCLRKWAMVSADSSKENGMLMAAIQAS